MNWTRAGAVVASAGMLLAVTAASASAAAASKPASPWRSSVPGATTSFGTSAVMHNNFGSGQQTIWADSPSNWGVTANQLAGNKVVSYPHVQILQYNAVSSMPILQGIYHLSQPGSGKGTFAAAYDMRIRDNAVQSWNNITQVMVWVDNQGEQPLGRQQTTGRSQRFTGSRSPSTRPE